MSFHAYLSAAFEQRRRANPRYSLRSFARSVAVDHSTLSQILRKRRRLTSKSLRRMAVRLGLNRAHIDEYCALENEAAILQALSHRKFRADSRWLAMLLNIPIDEINVALQRLLRKRLIAMDSRTVWRARTGI
jgi:transcriptional regulator with XRE-family HTH domain